jgi:enoyl-CoA hydratase/carnithine racemase
MADIDIRVEGCAGRITFRRPQALNALTHAMLLAIEAALGDWREDGRVAHVVIDAEGRAFSAGGDLAALYDKRDDGLASLPFFADEYRINAAMRAWPKPIVALIKGVVMGGGVGASFHGSHRVMTQNAAFAMPEVGIGFFPDVGGSYLLSRLPDHFGLYLGLTGKRARMGDALWSGLATHAVDAADLASLGDQLCQSRDTSAVLEAFAMAAEPETAADVRAAIKQFFGHPTLEAVITDIRSAGADGDSFAGELLSVLSAKSPTSLHVAFRQIKAGTALTMEECMAMEYRVVARMLQRPDFYEGIRTVIIDKGDKPDWQPASLELVDKHVVDQHFAPWPAGGLQF